MRLPLLLSTLSAIAHARPQQHSTPPFPIPTANVTSYIGNACPQGTAFTVLFPTASPANYTLIIYFDGPHAVPMPAEGTRAARYSKNCAVHFNIAVPHGWRYYVNSGGTDFRGYIWLPDGSTTFGLSAQWYFPVVDAQIAPSNPVNLTGPYDGHNVLSGEEAGENGHGLGSPCGISGKSLAFNFRSTMSITRDGSWPLFGNDIEDEKLTVSTGIGLVYEGAPCG